LCLTLRSLLSVKDGDERCEKELVTSDQDNGRDDTGISGIEPTYTQVKDT